MNVPTFIFVLIGILNFLQIEIHGKKILFVEFFGTKSHILTYVGLLEELSRHGHNVTLLAPATGFAKAGIKEIFSVDTAAILNEGNNWMELKEKNPDYQYHPFDAMAKLFPKECGKLYDRPDIQALMTDEWDLVIFQPIFNDCALGLIHKIIEKNKCPLILFTPGSAFSNVVSPLGGHYPPSTVPNPFLPLGPELNLIERMQNFVMELFVSYMVEYTFVPAMEAVYKEKLGADVPAAKDILSKASILLSNGHFSIHYPRPNYPDVIDIGGIHSHPAKPLPKDLADFVEGSGDAGFIYFSFGSIIPPDMMSESKLQVFLNVFSKLKQRIIWKYDGKKILKLPSNVKLGKWLPQQDLLGHPKAKLFITHCGMGGIQEAIYHGVPMLGIPIIGDQPLNALQAEKKGILVLLDWSKITEEYLENGIKEAIQNRRYQNTVKELSRIFRDQIDNPLDRAVWWTEYVLRHNGAPHLRSSSRKLNFIQYHSLDVIGILLAVFLFAIFIIFKIIKYIYGLIFVRNVADKRNKNKRD